MPKGFKKEITRLASSGNTVSVDDVILQRAIADEQRNNAVDTSGEINPVVTQEQLQAIADLSAKNAVEQISVKHQAEIEEIERQKQEADVKALEAETTAKNAVEMAAKQAEERIAAEIAKSEEAIALANAQIEEVKKERETIEGLFKLSGIQMPNFNQSTNPLNQEPQGMARDLVGLISDTNLIKANTLQDPVTGLFAKQKNLSAARDYVAIHFAECRSQGVSWRNSALLKDVEKFFKAHGFLSGNMPVTNAPGATIGIPGVAGDVFLDILSTILRETHNQSNVFWQFTTTIFNSASAPSQNILVPRFLNLPTPTDITQYELATSSTYTPVQAAIGTNTDSQSLEVTTVPISVTHCGLGKAGTVQTRPIFIPEFHNQISLISLLDAVGTRLMQNYYAFEELLIRRQYERASTVLYNSNGNAVSTPADVATGQDGTFTEAFANSVYTELYANKVPTYPDGCYVLVLNPFSANQYRSSLEDQYAPVTVENKQAVANIFRMAHGVEIGHVNNYMGMYNNFHVFTGNSFGVGAAGTVPTVNNVTFGGGAQDAVDSFAFGPGCVGRGVALAAETRASGVNPFQLGEAYIWLSREGVAPMDLDATIPDLQGNLNQQTRCYKLRTSKREI